MAKVLFWYRKPWCYIRPSRFKFPYSLPRKIKNRIKAEKQLDNLIDLILDEYNATDPHPPTKPYRTVEEALENILRGASKLYIDRISWFR